MTIVPSEIDRMADRLQDISEYNTDGSELVC